MSEIVFKPNLQKRRSYSVVPDDQNLRRGLDMIFSRGNLRLVMNYAMKRQSWMAEFGWGGLEYPTRADRAGMVRYCWLPHPQAKRLRKCHAPESEYLGLLLGIARHCGWSKQVLQLQAMGPQSIDVRLTPDRYELEDYVVRSASSAFCLTVILSLFDFGRARALAQTRQGFSLQSVRGSVHYGLHELEYLQKGSLRLRIKDSEKIVSQQKYLEVLDTVLKIHGLEQVGGSDG